jgi:hypothetical protein
MYATPNATIAQLGAMRDLASTQDMQVTGNGYVLSNCTYSHVLLVDLTAYHPNLAIPCISPRASFGGMLSGFGCQISD